MHRRVTLQISPVPLAVCLAFVCGGCYDDGNPSALPADHATSRVLQQSNWPIFRGIPGLDGVARGALPDHPELRWTFETGGAIVSSPVIQDGRVYIGSDDGDVYCLDFETGTKLWSFETEYEIEAPPLVHNGMVYVGATDFFLYAIDAATGELKWKYETDDRILGGANVLTGMPDGRDRIVAGSYDNHLYCFDAETGEKLWVYETLDWINGTPAVSGDEIIFGGCDTALYVISAEGEPRHRIEIGEECFIAASVSVVDGRVYFGHHANAFLCVDLATESIQWAYENPSFGFFSAPAVGDERIVFGGRDSRVHCVGREDGTPLWTFPTRRKVDGSPVICGNRVVVGSGDGRLYILDLEDGSLVWSYDIGKSIFSSPAVVDGVIVIGANDGVVYAFGEGRGAPTKGDE